MPANPVNIVFTDAIGTATLDNAKPAGSGGDRFKNWNPSASVISDEEESLGTGQLFAFIFRNEYLVSFELPAIPRTSMAIMLRLQRHLKSGGSVTVNTGDSGNRSYATCCLVKGTNPEPKLTDPKNLEYSMQFTLRNIAAVPTDFLCLY